MAKSHQFLSHNLDLSRSSDSTSSLTIGLICSIKTPIRRGFFNETERLGKSWVLCQRRIVGFVLSVGIIVVRCGQKSTASFPILLTYHGLQNYVPHNYWLDSFHRGPREKKFFFQKKKIRICWKGIWCCVNEESSVLLMLLESLRSETAETCSFASNIDSYRCSNSWINVTVGFFFHQGINQHFHCGAFSHWKVIVFVHGNGIVFVLNCTKAKDNKTTRAYIFFFAVTVGLITAIGMSVNKQAVLESCCFVKLSVLLFLLESVRLEVKKNCCFAFNNDLPRFSSSSISETIGLILSIEVSNNGFFAVIFWFQEK